ncbi:MAG: roadblock/LC7 domain-containing protein [Cardiobacteriaceae bacterium]|nr:roadblock/LC7 domain-containing protein [Cardiobacteriaceae bacterium]
MATLEDYRENTFVTYCNRALEAFSVETPGVKNVLLATPDGFEIASHADSSKHSADNLAAVGSSLFALGSSLISEFDLGTTKSITIDSERGKVYICSVSVDDKALIIMIQSTQNAMLAHILHGANKLSDQIGKRLMLIS